MRIERTPPNSLLNVSSVKRLHLINIVMECRKIYGMCLDFLDNHPREVDADLLKELTFELIHWYKNKIIPPYVLVTTARYVLAKVRRDFESYWNGKSDHPRTRYERGYDTAWNNFKVPYSNLLLDPYRREIYISGIGLMQYQKSLRNADDITAVTIYIKEDSQFMCAEISTSRK